MSFQVTTAFVKQYHANIEILSQQMGSRLRSAVRVESQVGEHGFYDQISATAARKRTTRHGDTPLIETPHARRRVTLVDYDWADLVDDLDKVKMLVDPASSYAQNAAYAFGRAMDDAIIDAAFGTAYTGVDGATSTSFPTSTNQVAGGSANITIAKLLSAKEIFDGYEVDESIPRYIACSTSQISALLNTTEVKSSDYNTVKALARGELDTFLGFKFIRTERLSYTSPDRRIICWAKDGLLLAVGQDAKAKITERADKNYSTQVYYSMSIGATRMDENKVVEIVCDES